MEQKHNNYLQITGLWFNNLRLLLHWIYYFFVQEQKPSALYELIPATRFSKEYQNPSELFFWIEYEYKWTACLAPSITSSEVMLSKSNSVGSSPLQKSLTEKKCLISISHYSIILTTFCLFYQEQAVIFLFSHPILSLVHLLG